MGKKQAKNTHRLENEIEFICPLLSRHLRLITDKAGLQVKDSQILQSADDGLYLACPNIRLIGDLISGNGTSGATGTRAGVHFLGEELTVADGVIEQSGGPGLFFDDANQASVSAMYFDNNGKYKDDQGNRLGGAAIQVNDSRHISVCGNHIHRSYGLTGGTPANYPAQIGFAGNNSSISVCGNVYFAGNTSDEEPIRPDYVYDATTGTSFGSTGFFENPQMQAKGVYSPNMVALLPQYTVAHVTPNALTGFTLSNGSSVTKADISPGTASDSSNTALIKLLATCTINLAAGANGLGHLDTGGITSGVTYFFFVVANADGTGADCIASASQTPALPLARQYGVFRMVGALYAITVTVSGVPTVEVVPFHQDGDTFYLASPAVDINTDTPVCTGPIGTGFVPCALSVPNGIQVQAFGRVLGGGVSSKLIIYSPDQTPGTPSGMSSSPGYSTKNSTGDTVFPFAAFTNTSKQIRIRADGANTKVYEITDGWVFHRGR